MTITLQTLIGNPNALEGARMLRQEMDARGWHDNDWRAGLAAIVGGESRFIPSRETGYAHTANSRIRMFFSKARSLSDAQLNQIKASDVSWFDFVYGGRFGNRPGTHDGFNYRGGGLNQLTFLDNYAKYGPKVGADLLNSPSLITAPRIAAAVAVEYMIDRFKGGDFDDMKKAVGVSLGEPDELKNQLYEAYTESGEWDYNKELAPIPDDVAGENAPAAFDPVIADFFATYDKAAQFLKDRNLYTGPIGDFDPGPGFRAGIKAYLKTRR